MARKKPAGILAPPLAEYTPTETEAAALARMQKRRRERRRLPKVTVSTDGSVAKVGNNHKDLVTGRMLELDALGLGSETEYTALLKGVLNFTTGPDGKPNEQLANEALQLIVGMEPRSTTETMLAVQMAAVHLATMAAAHRMHRTPLEIEIVAMNAKVLNNLARTFAMQAEAMKKLKGGGQQKVVVEHKHYYLAPGAIANSNAVLGDVAQGRGTNEIEQQPHEHSPGLSERTTVHSDLEANGLPLQSAGGNWLDGLPLPWSEGRSPERAS